MTAAARDPLPESSSDDVALTTALIGRALTEVVHDLSGHLSGLLGMLALAQLELDETHPVMPRLVAAEGAAHEINRLRSWLLSYVRGDDMPRHAIDLNQLVEDDLPMLTRLLADRAGSHVKISAQLAPDLRLVLAELTPLRRVLLNLVINARDACRAWGHVAITTRNEDRDGASFVMLSVRDNGSGMSKETQARILRPGGGHTTKAHGTGLGLAACRRAIESYGGDLEIVSGLGYGTIVTVTLPAAAQTDLHELESD